MRNWIEFGEDSVVEAGRKRKVETGDSSLAVSLVQLKTRRLATATTLQEPVDSPESSGNSTCESVASVMASCCSSEECSDLVERSSKFVDLQETDESSLEFFATSAADSMNCRDRRETTLSSTGPRHRLQKMPSEVEIERFFAAAEKNLQEQFLDKYNYDIAKDKPVEGTYEWVEIQAQLKP